MLPEEIKKALDKTAPEILSDISEIRLRNGGISTATVCDKNLIFSKDGITNYIVNPVLLNEKDIDNFMYRVCGGSVYSYESSISKGFITVKGIRMGLSGDVTVKNGKVCGFSEIRSINIRLPRHIHGCADEIISFISKKGIDSVGGILIASRPGAGKTTFLRELAVRLSSGINESDGKTHLYRVSVADERNELYIPELFASSTADILSGIPKNDGIELASRVLCPEIIIFDEIGSETDASNIISAHFGGSTFIASVHADSLEGALNKTIIKRLASEGVFSYIYFLERTENGVKGTLCKIGGRSD